MAKKISRSFKFHREKNKFIWENYSMKLEYSDPSGQAYDDYAKIKSVKSIMYFYYNVAIYKRKYRYNNKDQQIGYWELVGKRHVFDFPTVEQLEGMIEYLLPLDTSIDGEKIEYTSGTIGYRRSLHSEGFVCEDCYELSKLTRENKDIYTFYAGVSYDTQGDCDSAGIRIQYLDTNDVKELLKCVQEFFKYTVDKYNNGIDEQRKKETNNKIFKDGKLYELTDKKDEKYGECYEHIYVLGDGVDVTYLIPNEEFDYRSMSKTGKITRIESDKLEINNELTIDMSTIQYISYNDGADKVTYTEPQIVEDFLSIMSEDDKKYFKENPEDMIFAKYYNVIVNRSWMCRDEHDFEQIVEDRYENVKEIVKRVIQKIKNM